MSQEEVLNKIMQDIRELFAADSSGHDIDHMMRVYKTARRIAEAEGADMFTVSAAALLHDADDYKIFKGTEDTHENAVYIMKKYGFQEEQVRQICRIIEQVSFSGTDSVKPDSLEGMVVQDADRLDAIGAIGIARAFAYGGAHHRKLYDPDETYNTAMNKAEYRASVSSTIAHFHEKLLLLKDMMNTETARSMACGRHTYMEKFLEEFRAEWEGEI
ncbi:MAG: HD domain-containing protein [Solobacterium sp.]|nr:HD domain-containing protein [Solobacterium sp.]